MRVVEGILKRDLGQSQALETDRDALQVHHSEHPGQAAVLFTKQVPGCLVENQ